MLRKRDPSEFAAYLEDSSGLSNGYAEEIVFPKTETEAAEFLKEASDKNSKVTISGAGTGVVGGRIPYGGVILSTDKLNQILEIIRFKDQPGGLAVVEPGVSIENLNREIKKLQLRYLPNPTEKNAFVGGAVGTNASGARGFKYGSTRKYVNNLRVVLAQGQILSIKRGEVILKDSLYINLSNRNSMQCPLPNYVLPKIKNAAGYFIGQGTDLIDLFIGQEGTLGLISAVGLKLNELPAENFSGLVFFTDQIKALDFVNTIKRCSYLTRQVNNSNDIDVACIEYFDQNSLGLLSKEYSQIPKGKKAAIYFEQDIFSGNQLTVMEKYTDIIEKIGVNPNEIWLAESSKNKDLLNDLRYDLPVLINEKTKHNRFSKISTDISVDDEHFPAMFRYYQKKLQTTAIPYCLFGHIGENHLHLNLMPEKDDDFIKAKQMYLEFITEAVRLKGTISAEHGIGKLKAEYLKIMVGDKGQYQMGIVKRTLDPALILGIGNILDEKLLRNI